MNISETEGTAIPELTCEFCYFFSGVDPYLDPGEGYCWCIVNLRKAGVIIHKDNQNCGDDFILRDTIIKASPELGFWFRKGVLKIQKIVKVME